MVNFTITVTKLQHICFCKDRIGRGLGTSHGFSCAKNFTVIMKERVFLVLPKGHQ